MNLQRTVWGDIVDTAQGHLHGIEWNLNATISLLRRRWTVLAGCVVVCLLLAVALIFAMTPIYTATALLQINTRQEQVVKMEDVVGGLSGSDGAIRTEVDVLTSRKLAGRVVDKLHLTDEAAFGAGQSVVGQIAHAVKFFLLPLKTEQRASAQAALLEKETRHAQVVSAFLDNLQVELRPRSYSIVLKYKSSDPELAARIVNTLAQEYLNSQLEDRFEATQRANNWIKDRLKQLQKQVQTSEMAVQKFREAHGLTEAKGVLLSEQQLSELNSQLILARTQLAEAQAKFQRAKQLQASGRGIENASEVLNNQLIMNLREQEAEVRQSMSDLASRYGERHPRMVNIRNQLQDLQRKIYEEISKIQGSLENNVAVAQARVGTLQNQLDALEAKNNLSSDAHVQLAELERQFEAEKELYESFLGRSKEIAQMDFAQTDARVISAAEVPFFPTSPRKMLVMVAALILGSGLGAALILLLESMDSGFRTSSQLEDVTDTKVLGLLGELPPQVNVAQYVLDKPSAAFTEAVRAIRTTLQFVTPDAHPKVILLTSSVPQEGKSMLATSLAQICANAGIKTLLVDADLRRPNVATQLALQPKAGLAELLIGQAKPKDVIIKLAKTGLFVLPTVVNTQFAQELLGSRKMRDLMQDWRKEFELIIVDTPPVMAVADAITLSGLADTVLFMVRWGTTPRQLVLNTLKYLKTCNVPLAGCVLSRVDLEKQQAYGYGDYGYYYGKYKEYYSDN